MTENDNRRADDRRAAGDLREELEELSVDALVRARRASEALERAGVTADLVRGTGDLVYGLIVQQLLLGARAVRRTQELSERLATAGTDRGVRETRRLIRSKVVAGGTDSVLETVHNWLPHSGELSLEQSNRSNAPQILGKLGRQQLEPGRSTSLLVTFSATGLDPRAEPVLDRIEVFLTRGREKRLIAAFDVELWILPA